MFKPFGLRCYKKRGTTDFFYDKVGRLFASQNAKQKLIGSVYSYTYYDNQNRIIEVGEKTGGSFTGGIGTLYALNHDMDTSQINYWLYSGTNAQLVNTYYDQSQFGTDLTGHYPMFIQENIRKRVSSITLRNSYSDPTNEFASAIHYSYDISGNVKTVSS